MEEFGLVFAYRIMNGRLHINFFQWKGHKINFRIDYFKPLPKLLPYPILPLELRRVKIK